MEDTNSLHPLCSNDLRARRSIRCLAPPLRCLRDLFCWWLGTVSLTINLVPSHYNSRRCCSLPGFMLMVGEMSFCLHAFLGVLLPTTLVHSQLRQKRLMRTTCFGGAPSGNAQSASSQPFFSVTPFAQQISVCEGPLVDCLIK